MPPLCLHAVQSSGSQRCFRCAEVIDACAGILTHTPFSFIGRGLLPSACFVATKASEELLIFLDNHVSDGAIAPEF